MLHGLHGRKGLHQVETCGKIVHLWCPVVLVISESPGWELILDWIPGATPWGRGFSHPIISIPDTLWLGCAVSQPDSCSCCLQDLESCNCLTNIYSISAYGLDFVFCSQLEGHFSSGKHRRNLVWLGRNPACDAPEEKTLPWQLCCSFNWCNSCCCHIKPALLVCEGELPLWVITNVPASPRASAAGPSICLRYTNTALSLLQEVTYQGCHAAHPSRFWQPALSCRGLQLLLRDSTEGLHSAFAEELPH